MTGSEAEIRAALEAAWGVILHPTGERDPWDFWAEKDGRTVALVEVKDYTPAVDDLTTTMIGLRKWVTLLVASVMTGVRGLYVVRFGDGSIRWVDVAMVDTIGRVKPGGRTDRVGHPNDWEPIIRIPIRTMGVVR